MNRIVLATSNQGKLLELQALLEPLRMAVLSLSQFTTVSPEETGWTFVENALLKARHACHVTGLPSIADDSGLEVDALGGEPGIHSARYAGEAATDDENMDKLLGKLAAAPQYVRTARYRCVIVLLRWERDPAPLICQATWEGRIATERRGNGGFGYDPIFLIENTDSTAAELPLEEKNRVSHRGKALRELAIQLVHLKSAVHSPERS